MPAYQQPGPWQPAQPQKTSSAVLGIVLGVVVALVLVLAAAGIGTYLVLRRGTDTSHSAGTERAEAPAQGSDQGSDQGSTGSTDTKLRPVTSRPSRVWQWRTGADLSWAVPGPGFTLAALDGKGGFVALDDHGKEKWRGETHPYSTLWADEADKVIEASWYVASTSGKDDRGTILYDYDGKVLWRQTGDAWFYDIEKDGDYLVQTGSTLKKIEPGSGKAVWSIPATDYQVTDAWIYTLDGDRLTRYSRQDAQKGWSRTLPWGWKSGVEDYDIDFRANDDLLVLTAASTYGFSPRDGHQLFHTADRGSLVELADNRFTVVPSSYDASTGKTVTPKGPFPLLAATGQVGTIALKATGAYAYMNVLKVDGKEVNFHVAGGSLYDADGRLLESGYDHVQQVLDEGVYRVEGTTVAYRPWHHHSDAWTLPLTRVSSLATTDQPDAIRVAAADRGLVVNDKHTVWFYR